MPHFRFKEIVFLCDCFKEIADRVCILYIILYCNIGVPKSMSLLAKYVSVNYEHLNYQYIYIMDVHIPRNPKLKSHDALASIYVHCTSGKGVPEFSLSINHFL